MTLTLSEEGAAVAQAVVVRLEESVADMPVDSLEVRWGALMAAV